MFLEKILSEVRKYEGVLELAPQSGSDYPDLAWGDYFFYYAPDGQLPRNRQPFATIVTKNYPDDEASRLDHEGRWRLNIHVGAKAFAELVGYPPDEAADPGADYSTADSFLPHPLYGAYGWVCVVTPASATIERALEALHVAYRADRRRVERRLRRGDASRTE